tara:strand:- start:291 stop:557 length:267 start_codon:yes stop_codon:yes gene_type:complete
MEIQLKLYGSSQLLSDEKTLPIKLPKNSNIKKLRDKLGKIISNKNYQSNLTSLHKTAAFFSDKNEIIDDNYKLKDKELISIIPPIGGG